LSAIKLYQILFVSCCRKPNLQLTSRRARRSAATEAHSPLQKQWAAILAALQNRSKIENSLIVVRLYEAARTYFIANC
jgi:hypothetical protein